MGLIMKLFCSYNFSIEDWFETFARNWEDDINILELELIFWHIDLIFAFGCLIFEFFYFLPRLEISDHFAQISEKGPGVIITVSFPVSNLALFISALFFLFLLFRLWLFLQITNMESLENWSYKSFDFFDERRYGFSFGIEKKGTS